MSTKCVCLKSLSLFFPLSLTHSPLSLSLLPISLPEQSFLSDLCEVEDYHESLQLEEYIALCRQDIAIEITVQEMACLHTLLLKYRGDIVSLSSYVFVCVTTFTICTDDHYQSGLLCTV